MGKELFERLKRYAKELGVNPEWIEKCSEPQFEVVRTQDEDSGSKNPMILLHGLLGALSNWDSTIGRFSEYVDPIALKFPIAQGPKSFVQVKSLVLLTIYYIESNDLDKVILCGNSLGGHVALRLCLLRPDLVKGLILSGSSGLYEHAVDSLPSRPNHEFINDQMRRVFVNEQFINDQAIEEVYEIVQNKERMLNIIHAARSAKKDFMEKLLPHISVPTLLLWGNNDLITTPDTARQFNRLIPNSKLVMQDNCGHAPMIEHPEWFAEEVRKFLLENKLI